MAQLDQQQTTHTTVLTSFEVYGNYYTAQAFQAGMSGKLYSVKLWLLKVGSPNNLIVEFQGAEERAFPESGFKPDGVVLASEEVLASSITHDTELEIVFSIPPNYNSGSNYAIVIYQKSNGGDSGNYYDWKGINSDPYKVGEGYDWSQSVDGGSSWDTWYGAQDLYFKTYVTTGGATEWNDIDCDVRVLGQELYDISNDVRVVDAHTVIRDIDCDVRSAQQLINDINCDVRVLEKYEKLYDINTDVRSAQKVLNDINCDVRCASVGEPANILSDIDCDVRVLSRQLYDVNCDVRCKESNIGLEDINCDVRVKQETPTGLDEFRVYLDGNEITDVEVDSIRFDWSMNESPASASFRIVRKSDNFNTTLKGVSQAVDTDLPIEIKFNGNLRYYGYVMFLDVEQSGESVVVNCLDRKYKVQEELLDVSYGRKWETIESGDVQVVDGDYTRTGNAITYILDELVTKGIISSYSGVPTGIIPEYQETQAMPLGTLITELLDLSGNYYWNITPAGILEIYESANGVLKNLPLQKVNQQVNLYDVLNYRGKLNDRSNLITQLEVNMGTESEENRASYKLVAFNGTVTPAWDRSYDNIYNQYYGSTENIEQLRASGILPAYRSYTEDEREKMREVGRKWRISSWADGSFIDNSFKPYVIGFDNFKINGWSWNGEYLTLATPLLEIKSSTKYSYSVDGEAMEGYHTIYKFKSPVLVGMFYKKENVSIASEPTVFDVTWNGIAGAGGKRRATFSQLGIRDAIGWTVYENGLLVSKSEPGYNDTEYATDRAKLMLSKLNDPITEGGINLTFDAFEFYELKLGNKINLTNTEGTNIYKNNNGFPLDIQSISFDAGSYNVTLNVKHLRNFKATVNYR